jgi:hypothetical protein
VEEDYYEYEDSQEYSIAEISKNLPEELSEELAEYVQQCGLSELRQLNTLMGGDGQLRQMVIMSEYSILQFGVLLTTLKEHDLVLADDAKEAIGMIADILATLAGHMELLLAPKIKH